MLVTTATTSVSILEHCFEVVLLLKTITIKRIYYRDYKKITVENERSNKTRTVVEFRKNDKTTRYLEQKLINQT